MATESWGPDEVRPEAGSDRGEHERRDGEAGLSLGVDGGCPMVRTEWPPRPRLIITVGVVIGLGVPLMFPDSIAMQPDAVSLLIVGNVAAVGMVLLLIQGPWRRAAASFTLSLAF